MSERTERWEDVIRLLHALSEEDIAAVRTLAEELAQRKGAMREARAAYVTPVEIVEDTIRPAEQEHQPATLEEALDFLASGPAGFLPGELDQLLADIEQARDIELEIPCQPT